jgi:coenzyme F420-0:L-glutamate ligase/coenzyme F420-1:gamma-L-glutamate ligase
VITVWAPDGVGEVRRGDDLAEHLLAVLARPVVSTGSTAGTEPADGTVPARVTDPAGGPALGDGDIVCVTSKVVSKAEGRTVVGDRASAIVAETRRLVARRGPLQVVVNRLGLTMAAAGVDASNVEPGTVLLLPENPDATARSLRATIAARVGANVAVLVTDTAGRAWREGQTDLAIGAAGLHVLDDHVGRVDPYGNTLAVTAPAVADEIAGAAELAAGKLGRRPFAVLRGRGDLVLGPEDDGPGAVALLRPEGGDLFGLGSREAVLAALVADDVARPAFGSPADADDLRDTLSALLGQAGGVVRLDDGGHRALLVTADDARALWVARVAAYAHGWRVDGHDASGVRLRPITP